MSHFILLPGRGWLGAGSPLRVSQGPASPWDPARDGEETLVSQNRFSFPTRVSPCSCEARRQWKAGVCLEQGLETAPESKLPHVTPANFPGASLVLETQVPREKLLGVMLKEEKVRTG